MILTVCPNPCIDCTLEIEDFKVGRLNRLSDKIENTSGKALNTAVGISRLGEQCFAGGFMFETGGRRFERFLKAEGIPYEFVWMKGSVRVNYKIIDGKSMMTEINDKGGFVSASKSEELLASISRLSENAETVVISGSLPQGLGPEYYYKLVKSVPQGRRVVVDCEGDYLKQCLKAGVFLIKPNLYELENFFGKRISSIEEVKECAVAMTEYGTKRVMVSLGRNGAVYTDGVKTYYSKSENVAVNSTVGAGDSMIAAACIAFNEGVDMSETLKRAVAAGTASVTTPGTSLFTKEKYLEILGNLTVEEI